MTKASKRIAASAAAVAAMAMTATFTAAPASAATSGYLEVCSFGNYASYVQFPWRGGWSTYVVPRGTCLNTYIGTSSAIEPIQVRGIYNTSSNTFWISNGNIRPSRGGGVDTYGTTAANNHWASIPSV